MCICKQLPEQSRLSRIGVGITQRNRSASHSHFFFRRARRLFCIRALIARCSRSLSPRTSTFLAIRRTQPSTCTSTTSSPHFGSSSHSRSIQSWISSSSSSPFRRESNETRFCYVSGDFSCALVTIQFIDLSSLDSVFFHRQIRLIQTFYCCHLGQPGE